METTEELQAFLTQATQEGVQRRLLYRGAAWSLMRTNGILPQGAPALGATIETDLANHGFALLRAAMALRARVGSAELSGKAFERAGNAFEALIKNEDPESPDRGFRRTIAAAAYHLAGFSAVAYSLFNETAGDLNLTPAEAAVMRLILRDLDGLRTFVRGWLNDEAHGDDRMAAQLFVEDADLDEVLSTILNTTICRALAFFDFALETGDEEPLNTARSLLAIAVNLADNAENVPQWWMSNLCRHLIDDLWQHSLHQNLPTQPPEGAEEQYISPTHAMLGSRPKRRLRWPLGLRKHLKVSTLMMTTKPRTATREPTRKRTSRRSRCPNWSNGWMPPSLA